MNRKILERICYVLFWYGERDYGNYFFKFFIYRSIKVKNSFLEVIYIFIGKILWYNRRKNSVVGNFFCIFVIFNYKFIKKDMIMK